MTLLNNEVKNSRESILVLFPFLIFIGKLLRWTLMKTILVDNSSGRILISYLTDDSYNSNWDSLESIVPFYKLINIFNLTSLGAYEIYLSVVLNIILLVIFLQINRELSVIEFIYYAFSVMVLNLFDFTLSKEPVQFLIFVAVFVALVNSTSKFWIYFLTSVLLIGCGIVYRPYFLLMAAYIVILVFFFKLCKKLKLAKWKIIIISVIGFTLFYFGILFVSRFVNTDIYTQLIRVRSRESSATTDIRAVFDSDNLFVFSCNYTLTIIRMMFPVELLRFGPKYYMYVVYQIIITGFVGACIFNINKLKEKQYIALIIMMSFILCSAAFEPDFGSWVRHEAVMLPIFIVMIDTVKVNERKITEK